MMQVLCSASEWRVRWGSEPGETASRHVVSRTYAPLFCIISMVLTILEKDLAYSPPVCQISKQERTLFHRLRVSGQKPALLIKSPRRKAASTEICALYRFKGLSVFEGLLQCLSFLGGQQRYAVDVWCPRAVGSFKVGNFRGFLWCGNGITCQEGAFGLSNPEWWLNCRDIAAVFWESSETVPSKLDAVSRRKLAFILVREETSLLEVLKETQVGIRRLGYSELDPRKCLLRIKCGFPFWCSKKQYLPTSKFEFKEVFY